MPETGGESPKDQTPPVIPVAEAWARTPGLEQPRDTKENGERLAQVLELSDALPKRPPKPLKAVRMGSTKKGSKNA